MANACARGGRSFFHPVRRGPFSTSRRPPHGGLDEPEEATPTAGFPCVLVAVSSGRTRRRRRSMTTQPFALAGYGGPSARAGIAGEIDASNHGTSCARRPALPTRCTPPPVGAPSLCPQIANSSARGRRDFAGAVEVRVRGCIGAARGGVTDRFLAREASVRAPPRALLLYAFWSPIAFAHHQRRVAGGRSPSACCFARHAGAMCLLLAGHIATLSTTGVCKVLAAASHCAAVQIPARTRKSV